MGASMTAIIEWTNDAQCAAEGWDPGPDGLHPRWDDDHLHGILFTTDKEYDFFAAVAGVRSQFDRPPLFSRRPLPSNLSAPAEAYFGHRRTECAGWLHPSEVDAALHHMVRGLLLAGFELRIGLELMRLLAARLGDRHVRLVFEIGGA